MFLSQTAEYALRAVVWLGDHTDNPQTTRQIAEATRLPASYLSKVLQALRRAELVTAQRGLHGGFMLTRPPTELTLLEVINSVEPMQRIRECPLGPELHGTRLCPLHQRLDDAMATVEQAFTATTIAELCINSPSRRPLCEAPKAKVRSSKQKKKSRTR